MSRDSWPIRKLRHSMRNPIATATQGVQITQHSASQHRSRPSEACCSSLPAGVLMCFATGPPGPDGSGLGNHKDQYLPACSADLDPYEPYHRQQT
jgi:hypothetical protein